MTAKRPDELLVEIRWPRTSPSWGWAFEELARRHHDFAIVGVGVGIELTSGSITDARIAFAGAGGTALRAPRRGADPARSASLTGGVC